MKINSLVGRLTPFTREGSQVQSLSRPPLKCLTINSLTFVLPFEKR